MIKRLLLLLLSAIIILVIILLFNAVSLKSVQPAFIAKKAITVSDSSVAHFQQGICFKTISFGNVPPDSIEKRRQR